MIDNLSQEIIKRVLADVGVLPDMLGKGLTDKAFLLEKRMGISYDDGIRYHNVYSGKISFSEAEMRGIVLDLSVEDEPEFMFVFRVDALPIHAVRMTYNAPEVSLHNCYLRIQNPEKKHWYNPSVELLARILAQFEKIVSYGVLWEECTEVSDLYEAAVKLTNGIEE